MGRELTVVTIVVLLLVLAAEACGAPPEDVSTDSPAARATNVRRTEVAAVQRIIANNSAATPLPSATATPLPSCPNAIWWSEARLHLGESRPIQGTVVEVRPAPGGRALLEMGQPYPDPTGLAIISPITVGAAADLTGKTVCATGRIMLAEGRPTVQIPDQASIVVID